VSRAVFDRHDAFVVERRVDHRWIRWQHSNVVKRDARGLFTIKDRPCRQWAPSFLREHAERAVARTTSRASRPSPTFPSKAWQVLGIAEPLVWSSTARSPACPALLPPTKGEDGHIRDGEAERNVEESVWLGPSSPVTPARSKTKTTGVQQSDVEVRLVKGPREEGGVDGHHRFEATHGHAGCRGHCVLLGDADVEESIGNWASKLRSPLTGHAR